MAGLAMQCVGDNDTPACRASFARGPDRQNDFGGTFGGPVWIPKLYNGHDRTFFFFSWEQFRQTVGGPVTSTVPTAAERTGDFSQFLQTNNVLGTNPCDGTPVYYGQIFDPSTTRVVNGRPCRTAFPGNIIPPGKISPVATNILKYYPAPQNSDIVNNYTLNSPYPINNTTYTIRIDEKFRRSTIYGSYSTRENTSLKASRTLPDPVDPNQWAQDFITHFGRFGWDYDFSPSLLNHLNLGTNRSNSKNFTVAALGNTNYSSQLGITNIDSTNFPIITVGESIDNLSNGHNGDNIDNGLRFNDSIFWQKGTTCAEVRHRRAIPAVFAHQPAEPDLQLRSCRDLSHQRPHRRQRLRKWLRESYGGYGRQRGYAAIRAPAALDLVVLGLLRPGRFQGRPQSHTQPGTALGR